VTSANLFLLSVTALGDLFGPYVSELPRPAAWNDPKTLPEPKPVALEQFYLAYRAFELPLPPKDAKFVRWTVKSVDRSEIGRPKERVDFNWGLMFRPVAGAAPMVVWCGSDDPADVNSARLEVVDPVPDPNLLGSIPNDRLYAFAAQAYHLGWFRLARTAFEELTTPGRILFSVSPAVFLHRAVWDREYESLTRSGTDRRKALARLKDLACDDPPRERAILKATLLDPLEATLSPSPPTTSRVESFIDGLTESTTALRPTALAELGLDAVPALVAHVADPRLTRTRRRVLLGCGVGERDVVVTVGDVCSQLLADLTADSVYSPVDDGPRVVREKVAKWFDEWKGPKEEEWSREYVYRPGGSLNESLADLIRAKYPHLLPEIWRRTLPSDQLNDGGYLTTCLLASPLDRALKITLFRESAGRNSFTQRERGLVGLSRLDPETFRRELEATLEWLSRPGSEAIEQQGVHTFLPFLGICEDVSTGEAFARTVRVRTVPERMLVLRDLPAIDVRDRRPGRSAGPLAFLLAMTEDRTKWDFEAWTGSPLAGLIGQDGIPRTVVGDYATLRLAEAIGLDVPWKPDRSASEWAALRKQVRAAVEKELAGKK
jgi:hypothetical protein